MYINFASTGGANYEKTISVCSRYVIGLFVFVFALLFITGTDYGQEFGNRGVLKARTGEKGILVNKARERFRAALETQSRHTKRLMAFSESLARAQE